jgi:diacylglycerol kinase
MEELVDPTKDDVKALAHANKDRNKSGIFMVVLFVVVIYI